jgi:hypothetical protein
MQTHPGQTKPFAPSMLNEDTAAKAQHWQRQGFKLPKDRETGLPIMPDDPRYSQYMTRAVSPAQRARYKMVTGQDMPEVSPLRQRFMQAKTGAEFRHDPGQPSQWQALDGTEMWSAPASVPQLQPPTVPMNRATGTVAGLPPMPWAAQTAGTAPAAGQPPGAIVPTPGMPAPPAPAAPAGAPAQPAAPVSFMDRVFPAASEAPNFATAGAMESFNRLFSQTATQQRSFNTLAEYDQWFSQMFDSVPGAAFVGNQIRDTYYLKAMPQNVRQEYDLQQQNRQLTAKDAALNARIKGTPLEEQGMFVGGEYRVNQEYAADKAADRAETLAENAFKRQLRAQEFQTGEREKAEKFKSEQAEVAHKRKIADDQRKAEATAKRWENLGNAAFKNLPIEVRQQKVRRMTDLEASTHPGAEDALEKMRQTWFSGDGTAKEATPAEGATPAKPTPTPARETLSGRMPEARQHAKMLREALTAAGHKEKAGPILDGIAAATTPEEFMAALKPLSERMSPKTREDFVRVVNGFVRQGNQGYLNNLIRDALAGKFDKRSTL